MLDHSFEYSKRSHQGSISRTTNRSTSRTKKSYKTEGYRQHMIRAEGYVWGTNSCGQLSSLTKSAKQIYLVPKRVTFKFQVNKVACGIDHLLVLTSSRVLLACGSNQNGKLGIGRQSTIQPTTSLMTAKNPLNLSNHPSSTHNNKTNLTSRNQSLSECQKLTPVAHLNDEPIVDIACGREHSAAVSARGNPYTWGLNTQGALGLGSQFTSTDVPLMVGNLANIKSVACGSHTTFFVSSKGEVRSCGSNHFGQLGFDPADKGSVLMKPKKVKQLRGKAIVKVEAGESHTLFLSQLGQVFACGSNSKNQLALKMQNQSSDGIPSSSAQLVEIKIPSRVKDIACHNYSAALTEQGDLVLWGSGSFGNFASPVRVSGIPCEVQSFSLSDSHVGAVDSDGMIWVWGSNEKGELGLGDYTRRQQPFPLVAVANGSASHVAFGSKFSVAYTKVPLLEPLEIPHAMKMTQNQLVSKDHHYSAHTNKSLLKQRLKSNKNCQGTLSSRSGSVSNITDKRSLSTPAIGSISRHGSTSSLSNHARALIKICSKNPKTKLRSKERKLVKRKKSLPDTITNTEPSDSERTKRVKEGLRRLSSAKQQEQPCILTEHTDSIANIVIHEQSQVEKLSVTTKEITGVTTQVQSGRVNQSEAKLNRHSSKHTNSKQDEFMVDQQSSANQIALYVAESSIQNQNPINLKQIEAENHSKKTSIATEVDKENITNEVPNLKKFKKDWVQPRIRADNSLLEKENNSRLTDVETPTEILENSQKLVPDQNKDSITRTSSIIREKLDKKAMKAQQKENQELIRQITRMQKDMDKQTKKLIERDAEIDALQMQVQEGEKAKKDLKKLQRQRLDLFDQNDEIKEKDGEIQQLDHEVKHLKEYLRDARKQITQLKRNETDFVAKEGSLQDVIARLQAQNLTQSQQIDLMTVSQNQEFATVRDLRLRLDQAKLYEKQSSMQIETFDKQIQDLQNLLMKQGNEKTTEGMATHEHKRNIILLENEVKSLQGLLDGSKLQIEKLESDLKEQAEASSRREMLIQKKLDEHFISLRNEKQAHQRTQLEMKRQENILEDKNILLRQERNNAKLMEMENQAILKQCNLERQNMHRLQSIQVYRNAAQHSANQSMATVNTMPGDPSDKQKLVEKHLQESRQQFFGTIGTNTQLINQQSSLGFQHNTESFDQEQYQEHLKEMVKNKVDSRGGNLGQFGRRPASPTERTYSRRNLNDLETVKNSLISNDRRDTQVRVQRSLTQSSRIQFLRDQDKQHLMRQSQILGDDFAQKSRHSLNLSADLASRRSQSPVNQTMTSVVSPTGRQNIQDSFKDWKERKISVPASHESSANLARKFTRKSSPSASGNYNDYQFVSHLPRKQQRLQQNERDPPTIHDANLASHHGSMPQVMTQSQLECDPLQEQQKTTQNYQQFSIVDSIVGQGHTFDVRNTSDLELNCDQNSDQMIQTISPYKTANNDMMNNSGNDNKQATTHMLIKEKSLISSDQHYESDIQIRSTYLKTQAKMQNPHVRPDGGAILNLTDENTTPKIDYSVSDIHINDQESIQYIGQNKQNTIHQQNQPYPSEMYGSLDNVTQNQARQFLKQASGKKFEPAIHNTSEEVGPPKGSLHNAQMKSKMLTAPSSRQVLAQAPAQDNFSEISQTYKQFSGALMARNGGSGSNLNRSSSRGKIAKNLRRSSTSDKDQSLVQQNGQDSGQNLNQIVSSGDKQSFGKNS